MSEAEDRRIVQEIAGRFGPPAYMRRARLIESTWSHLVESGRSLRLQHLDMVGMRLAQLRDLAGTWDALRPIVRDSTDLENLIRLHDELQPRLHLPLETTTSERILRAALSDLCGAMERFNRRWSRWLAEVDLVPLNKLRADYNRYYLLEKECAVGAVAARRDYVPLAPLTREDLVKHLPLLTVPRV
ncbi:MAG TPA: hypothetical protein VFE62_07175 [Gemmataceae bacterium]|nr:hypothetical protein [Gemmataceae bacterium]